MVVLDFKVQAEETRSSGRNIPDWQTADRPELTLQLYDLIDASISCRARVRPAGSVVTRSRQQF
jgi:hypothetical protein